MQVNGWTLYAHPLFLDQLEKLTAAVEKARREGSGRLSQHGQRQTARRPEPAGFRDHPPGPDPSGLSPGRNPRRRPQTLVQGQVRRPALPAVLPLQHQRQGDHLRLGQRRKHPSDIRQEGPTPMPCSAACWTRETRPTTGTPLLRRRWPRPPASGCNPRNEARAAPSRCGAMGCGHWNPPM